nr:hypothetical protein [Escherichia coli]
NESTGPKVMICAHMDEVGFMVRKRFGSGKIKNVMAIAD